MLCSPLRLQEYFIFSSFTGTRMLNPGAHGQDVQARAAASPCTAWAPQEGMTDPLDHSISQHFGVKVLEGCPPAVGMDTFCQL